MAVKEMIGIIENDVAVGTAKAKGLDRCATQAFSRPWQRLGRDLRLISHSISVLEPMWFNQP